MLIIHGAAVLATFLAPYDPATQHRAFPYAPPTPLHFVDSSGAWHRRPFVCATIADEAAINRYAHDCARQYDLRWLVSNDDRTGFSHSERWPSHLFGVDSPGQIFLLGTDEYGRDQLSRLLVGARVSLLAALVGTMLALGFAILAGVLGGYLGAWVDASLTAFGELLLAVPLMYLLLAARAALPLVLGPADAFFAMTVLLGLVGWARPFHLIRAVTRTVIANDYVTAARGLGASTCQIARRHLMGEVMGVAVTQALVLVPQFVIAEVTLSFFGLGVSEPMPSWGTMLSAALRPQVLYSQTWLLAPVFALVGVSVIYYATARAFRASMVFRSTVVAPRASTRWRPRSLRALPLLWILSLITVAAGCARNRDVLDARRGGEIVVAERSGPRTFNPVLASDNPSKAVLGHLFSDLIHINRQTQQTEPALAASWDVSPDRKAITVTLRRNLRFADGHPCGVDDVLFSFEVYLDATLHAPQRDLLLVGGKPIGVRRVDEQTITFTFAEPYAVAERLFDGIAILPKHLLAERYTRGDFGHAWGIDAEVASIVGTGPFRLREHVAGERLVLDRNPHYWKRGADGKPLPYLDRVVVRFAPNEDAEVLRFSAGELDVLNRVGAEAFAAFAAKPDAGYRLVDAGPSLEYNFLFFNLNDRSPVAARARAQEWFAHAAFRHAVSAAVDREAIVRLVYQGRGEALWAPVTSGNRRWVNPALAHSPRSLDRARMYLRSAGFSWRPDGPDGTLVDARGRAVEFSLLVASTSKPRMQMATLIQSDLAEIGIRVAITPLEFRSVIDRVVTSKDYDASLLGLVSGDADPNSDINVWLSSGATHLWRPAGTAPASAWEAEIDDLMRRQIGAPRFEERKRMFDRVQALLAEHEPMVFLASPNVLAAAKAGLEGFRPAVLPHYTLWNVDELRWRAPRGGSTP
jgi:peptide/nickel transport system substrate-binding protein